MSKEILLLDLKTLLETINEQFVILSGENTPPDQFEYDLLTENIRKLYDKVQLLNKIVFPGSAPVQPLNPPAPPASPVIPTTPGFRVESRKSPSRKKPAIREPELFPEEESIFRIRLKEARDMSLGPKATELKPSHLKALIDINDKFLMINELFQGSLSEYNKMIETLNGFTIKGEAYGFLDSICRNNHWDPGSKAFLRLKESVDLYFG